jgi:hypothetical protein
MHRVFIAVCLTVCPLWAADLETWMTTRGKLVVHQDFSGSGLPDGWSAAKGSWSIRDGALLGAERTEDQHQAVISTPIQIEDGVFQFDFKLGGTKNMTFSLNDQKEHLCRVVIYPNGFELRKDGSKKDAADKPESLGRRDVALAPDRWHTMIVEISGKEMLARIDEAHYAFGENSKVARAKASLRFPLSGDAGWIDNIKVWQAGPNAGWTAKKATLTAPAPAKPVAKGKNRPAKKAN